ncbi:hypothetical protein UlMin_023686, partial [Ulmus minor]
FSFVVRDNLQSFDLLYSLCGRDAGLRWVLCFQDTNVLLFNGIPAAISFSATRQYHVNSLAVPRKTKEGIGGITRLTHADDLFVPHSMLLVDLMIILKLGRCMIIL